MTYLKDIWDKLASSYSDNTELVDKGWIEIEHSYTAKKRHYHNLSHLEYMVDKMEAYSSKLQDPDVILFSIFYHDIVYDTKRQDNELKSAEIAGERLRKLGLTSDKVTTCQNHILATKHHQASNNIDANFLVDFDLAILGEDQSTYLKYIKDIRAEYSIYPDFLYRRGRKKVLQHFLEMGHIFKTTEFRNLYEQRARENLNMELQEL